MQITRKTKIITIVSSIVALLLAVFIFFHFFFVYNTAPQAIKTAVRRLF